MFDRGNVTDASESDQNDSCECGVHPLVAPQVAQILERSQIAKYHTKGGHGFSAEDANNFADTLRGRNAEIVGMTNELNGADRLVDGIRVQSKYFQSASETVSAAFDSATGTYRYSGQVLEVPQDQYDACVELMGKRIKNGQVPGFSDSKDSDKIIRQGTITYKQARNIAKAGNIDSIAFDSKTQAVTSSYVFAISFAVTFAQNRWQGESPTHATRTAFTSAVAAGSTTLITGVISAQILRTNVAAFGAIAVRSGVRAVAGNSMGREAINRVAMGSLGKAVYGAAAVNHVSKVLRTNVVTGTIVALVTTTPDFYRVLFARSISWRQFTKNLTVNIVGISGGTVGFLGGAAAGAAAGSIVPVLGTAVGGIIGGIAGSLAAGIGCAKVTQKVANRIADDDSKMVVETLVSELETLAVEYLLTEAEIAVILNHARKTAKPKWLRKAFKVGAKWESEQRVKAFHRREFEPHFENLVKARLKIELPSAKVLEEEVFLLIELLKREPIQSSGAAESFVLRTCEPDFV
ncbi:MAG: hypothetical protein ABIT37_17300 [Luteolibacter sp.]